MAAPKGNQYALGNKGGREPFYKTPEQMEEAIEAYFVSTSKITINGLALHLGFMDRQSLFDYEKKEEFTCLIKTARSRVQEYYEENLLSKNPTGAIFALKNMGWTDRQDINYQGETRVDITNLSEEEKQALVDLKRKLESDQ